MASIALHLRSHHHKPSQTLLKTTSSNLTFSHFFSSSSSSDNNNNGGNTPDKSYPFSPYFSEIKSKFKVHEEQRQQQQQQSPGFRPSNNNFTPQGSSIPSQGNSIDEIRKNLSEFRRRSTGSSPESPPQQQPTVLQKLTRNVGHPNPNFGVENKVLSFAKISESLRNLNAARAGVKGKNMSEQMSLNNYRQNFKMRPTTEARGSGGGGSNMVIGGSFENLPMQVFGKEMKDNETNRGKEELVEDEMELITSYNYDELGKKLKELRPEIKGKKGGKDNWFSLSELGERLKKLKEIESKQIDDRMSTPYKELRRTLGAMKRDEKESSNNAPINSIDVLSPTFMMSPPKEQLVEKYFHPDNMSAEEKLKLELKRVRDDFKMHESDCGSARVQIAQLTTEILHLSSVLHKKDKHSRRGLLAKVQQRKKLLKYLRRTDWESYTFVLSKLGLRDNPDYKN